ncbi:MAG TPA: hypothetical protein VHU92_08450 [Streptosporangiaceae bacterium]|jgi:hypothetical protein|nr:hypothetical protein [Streptosporangiaceae bacterium]
MRTTMAVAVAAIVAAVIASQRQDIARYVRIRQMSAGSGHPEYVPVEGHHAYPD